MSTTYKALSYKSPTHKALSHKSIKERYNKTNVESVQHVKHAHHQHLFFFNDIRIFSRNKKKQMGSSLRFFWQSPNPNIWTPKKNHLMDKSKLLCGFFLSENLGVLTSWSTNTDWPNMVAQIRRQLKKKSQSKSTQKKKIFFYIRIWSR